MSFFKTLLLLLSIPILSCDKKKAEIAVPQKPELNWYKGNLHTHSYWSDGDEFPEQIMHLYKSNGYDFIALSDHNRIAEGERWISIKKDSIYLNAYKNYLNKYGEDWVESKIDSGITYVKLKTLEEYRREFEKDSSFLIVQAEEISDWYYGDQGKKPIHMVATNIKTNIEPQGGETVVEILQNNIDAVHKQSEETGIPMMVHVNHPNYRSSISIDDMLAIKRDPFFELFNGHPGVENLGDSTRVSTEEMWDIINIAHLNSNQPLLYGLATDDAHHYHVQGGTRSNALKGWVQVKTEKLSIASLIKALKKGSFYASTGVVLNDVTFENNILTVDVKAEEGITNTITFIGVKKGSDETEVLKTVQANKASFEVTDAYLFVRSNIKSSKLVVNPIETFFNELAWTQPVIHIK